LEESLSPRLGHILRELEYIIVAEGFLHLKTATLAWRLRCSKRALYSLAPTHEKLLEVLIRRVLDRTDKYLEKAATGSGNPRARLTRYMDAIVQASRPASARFLRDLTAFKPGVRLLQQHQRRTFDRLEQLISDGIQAGVFSDISPKLVTELISMAAARLVDPTLQRKLGLNLAESYEELSRLLYHGLLPHRDFGSAEVIAESDGGRASAKVRSRDTAAKAESNPRHRRVEAAILSPRSPSRALRPGDR
jgi:AcrR family transcriptional regulator